MFTFAFTIQSNFIINIETISAKVKQEEPIQEDRWELMYKALCSVESGDNPKAYHRSTNAAGILQIRPIYVREINRLMHTHFTLKDRYSPIKSRQMFDLYQQYYNPKKNINMGIGIHHRGYHSYLRHPSNNKWYLNRVLKRMKLLSTK